MGDMKLAVWPDPILNAVCEAYNDITILDAASHAMELAAVMRANGGIGISGPQIGLLKRIIVGACDTDRERWTFIMVNPKVVAHSKDRKGGWEGCLSLPGERRFILRWKQVTVEALDLLGKPVTIRASNLLAAVLQHEIDHLDGKLMTGKTGLQQA